MIFPYKTTKMTSELLENLEKLHTTELGVVRIKRNLGLKTDDVIGWCKNTILSAAKNIENEKSGENDGKSANKIFRQGKNWYIKTDACTITVNAHSYTVITAHKNMHVRLFFHLRPQKNHRNHERNRIAYKRAPEHCNNILAYGRKDY